jgi:hypothetical protein
MPKKTKTSKRAMSNKRDAPDQTVVFLSATVGPTARLLPAGRAARSSAHLTPAQGSKDTRVWADFHGDWRAQPGGSPAPYS